MAGFLQFSAKGFEPKACVDKSHDVFRRSVEQGLPTRYASGYTPQGERHRWVEYFYKDRWRVWDESQRFVGRSFYTAKEHGYTTLYHLNEMEENIGLGDEIQR